MKFLSLYYKFIKVYLKVRLEYRFSFFMDIFTQLFTYSLNYIGIWILLSHFKNINGWDYNEVMFLYNLNLLSYGVSGLFLWLPMRQLEQTVHNGEFDSFLVRPLPPLLYLIYKNFTYVFLGHIVIAAVFIIISLKNIGIHVSLENGLLLLCFIISAILIQFSIFIISGSMSFWFVKSSQITEMAIYSLRNFINYPITIYHKGIQIFLTFILPYAFINYYPSYFILQKKDDPFVNPYFLFISPVIAISFFLIALLIWHIGVNKYQSTGS